MGAFDQLFGLTTDAAFIEIDGRLADVNQPGLDLYRSTRDELIGAVVTDLVPPEHRALLGERPQRLDAGLERPRDRDEEILRSDGSRVAVRVRSQPTMWNGHSAVLVVMRALASDGQSVTAASERQRRRSITFTDVSLRLAMADERGLDQTIERVLGAIASVEGADRAYVVEAQSNRTRITCTHEWCAPSIDPQIDYVQDLPSADFPWSFSELLAGRTVHVPDLSSIPEEGRAERESFGQFGVRSILQVPMIVSGEVTGLVGFNSMERASSWSDETIELVRRVGDTIATALTRRNALRAIEQARRSAEEANRAKTSFLSRMSHELRTPLNAVLGFTELLLLEEGRGSGDQRLLAQVLESGRHLQSLVEDVLDISRIEAGGLTTSIEAVDLGTVVGSAIAQLESAGETTGLTIDHGTQLDGLLVKADRQRLHQVVLNLVSNACKYNQPGGSVTITAEAVDDHVRLSVTDTGVGIAGDDLPRVFEPFDRLGHEESGIEGTGVGLSLTKMLVELMDGEIEVTSTVGEGTTMVVVLPAAAPAGDNQNGPPGISGNRIVLGVEDNEASALLLRHVVERESDLSYVGTATITGALAAIRDRLPDLILLDLHLADGRGQDLLTRLKGEEATRAVPVIVITADNDPILRSQMLAGGAADFMAKPVAVARLREVIRDALDGR